MCRLRRCVPSTAPLPPPLSPLLIPTREEKRQALSHQQALQHDLSNLIASLKNSSADQKHVETLAASAQSHVQGLAGFLSQSLEPSYYNEIRADDSSAAQRTFDIPELFEMILDQLDIPDVLAFYQVSRGMKGAIEASTRLQTNLCLRAATSDSSLKTPFEFCLRRDNGFLCAQEEPRSNIYAFPEDDDNITSITASFVCILHITSS